jgi:hypothetical protein
MKSDPSQELIALVFGGSPSTFAEEAARVRALSLYIQKSNSAAEALFGRLESAHRELVRRQSLPESESNRAATEALWEEVVSLSESLEALERDLSGSTRLPKT